MTTANCFSCGKFCKSYQREGYDGEWNQIWITTMCNKCEEITEGVV